MNDSGYVEESECYYLALPNDSISFRYLRKGRLVPKEGWYFATREDVRSFGIPPRLVDDEKDFLVKL